MKTPYFIYLLMSLFCVDATSGILPKTIPEDSLLRKAIRLSDERKFAESFSTLSDLKALSEQKNNPEMLFWYYTNWGINLAEMNNYNEALDTLFVAYKIAINQLDTRKEMSIINNIAGLYMLNGKHRHANEYFMRNFNYAKACNDTVFLTGTALNVATTALELGDTAECRKYMDIAQQFAKKEAKEQLLIAKLRISYLLAKEKYAEAVILSKKILSDEGAERNIKKDVTVDLCKAYLGQRKFQPAITTALTGLEEEVDITGKLPLYEMLRNAYRGCGQFEKALLFTDSLILSKDSIQAKTDRQAFENNHIQFELLRKEKEISAYRARENRNRILLFFTISVAVLLGWALVNQIHRRRQKQRIAALQLSQQQKNEELLRNQLREQETQSQLRQKEQQLELEKKNRELMSKAMFTANKNELIQSIVNQLSQNVKIERNSSLEKTIRQLRLQLDENKEWEQFSIYFEETNKHFVWKLKERHPLLTANEVRFLSLIYIGLSNKEISSLLNITSEYCKKKRQAVARKLGIESTSLLYKYLSEI